MRGTWSWVTERLMVVARKPDNRNKPDRKVLKGSFGMFTTFCFPLLSSTVSSSKFSSKVPYPRDVIMILHRLMSQKDKRQ